MSTQAPATGRGGGRVALAKLMPKRVDSVDPASRPDDGFAYYSVEAFAAGQPKVVAGSALGSGRQALEPSDVLLSKIVAHPRRAWVVGVRQGLPQVASNDWIVLRSPHHDPGYLRHLLVSNRFHIRFMQSVTSNVQRARVNQIASIEIPLPSLSEQCRIAQVLDDADALRTKRRAMMAALDTLPQALFFDMFGDPTIGRSDSRLSILSDCLLIAPASGAAQLSGGDARWLMLRALDIRDGKVDLTDTTYVNVPPALAPMHCLTDGDLLLARTAGSKERIGDCSVVYPGTDLWTFDPQLIRLRFDRSQAEPEFVRHLFRSRGGRTLLARSTRRSGARFRVDPRLLAALEVALPPIELQREFARRIAAVEPLKVSTLRSGTSLDALIGTLRDRAFEGELQRAPASESGPIQDR